MADVLKDLQELRGEISALDRAAAKREAEVEAATKRRQDVLDILKSECDVDTIEEAKNLRKRLEDEVRDELEELKGKLRGD